MNFRWIGAMLIIMGCGGFGFTLAASHRKEMEITRQMINALNFMECELQYRLTPLPELCRQAASITKGCVRTIFSQLSEELNRQTSADAPGCMDAVLAMCEEVPANAKKILRELGICLGRFDLPGQMQGLESVRTACTAHLENLEKNADVRLRGYQTLGLCAGAALAILFV